MPLTPPIGSLAFNQFDARCSIPTAVNTSSKALHIVYSSKLRSWFAVCLRVPVQLKYANKMEGISIL